MKVFRELVIGGDGPQLHRVAEAITARLKDGWARDREAEERMGSIPGATMYCIGTPSALGQPAARLWLALNADERRLYVTNIVPVQHGELSTDTYNAIVQEFYDRFVAPVAAGIGVTSNLTNDNEEIEDWAGPRVSGLLRAFSAAANKTTGSSHPLDHQRWETFLIAAHQDHAQLTSDQLKRWLIEVEQWPDDIASDLAIEYEQGRSLLDAYDAARAQ